MYAVVVPDYVTLNYDCIISTYYVEQMNGIIEAINYASDSYWGNPERFQFRARIDSVATNVELPTGQERVVKSTFSIKMYGYIVPNPPNRTEIKHGDFTEFTDPPSTQVPNSRINTNRVPPTLPPD